ncbi:hypothetical protein [Mesorhizobium sp.]|uniref:hypothetical protein n=1 Tax=Mesorhizobium sp. TaxID=1871066 RepID=UPI000FE8C155|nr:hypothetical protein [Mesorhizobium sp.]RWB57147.1 MAG: hypothetical protein EOQ47_11225 [Mesorhizobium sp.]
MDVRNLIAMLSVALLCRRANVLTSPSEAEPRVAGRCASKAATAISSGTVRRASDQHVTLRQPIGCNRPVPSSFYGDPNLYGGKMKSLRMNNPLIVLSAVVLISAPFIGLAWRTHEWLGW